MCPEKESHDQILCYSTGQETETFNKLTQVYGDIFFGGEHWYFGGTKYFCIAERLWKIHSVLVDSTFYKLIKNDNKIKSKDTSD